MRIYWLGWLCGLAVVIGGCTVEPFDGELGIAACSDGQDNDGDLRSDCADPDCQAESVCGRAAPLREPDAGTPDRPTPSSPAVENDAGGSSGKPPVTANDGGPSSGNGSTPDATLPDPDNPPDAAVVEPEPPKVCDPACGELESCIEGYCLPNEVVFVELWEITKMSVVLPRGLDETHCLDTDCGLVGIPTLEFPRCPCMPDPMVEVWVTRLGEKPELVAEAHETDPLKPPSDDGEWVTNAQLQLRPEYEITLKAVDRDVLAADEVVLECTFPADPELLGKGTLGCEQTFTGARSMKVIGSVSIAVRPATLGATP